MYWYLCIVSNFGEVFLQKTLLHSFDSNSVTTVTECSEKSGKDVSGN